MIAPLAQPLGQAEVVGHQIDVAEAPIAQRRGDVLRHGAVGFVGSRVVRAVDDGARRHAVAVMDHRHTQAFAKPVQAQAQVVGYPVHAGSEAFWPKCDSGFAERRGR